MAVGVVPSVQRVSGCNRFSKGNGRAGLVVSGGFSETASYWFRPDHRGPRDEPQVRGLQVLYQFLAPCRFFPK
ncbi:MAG: hypothetical protein CMJ62_19645 [Planctomycetaceae bacterium]|nr:hypothetical protein [Planctomycetaceae bacterium]